MMNYNLVTSNENSKTVSVVWIVTDDQSNYPVVVVVHPIDQVTDIH